MHRVFVTDHFDRLHDRRDRKDAADHPVQVFLAARDAFHQPLTPKDEDTIPGQGSQPDADNVQVILTFYRLQDLLAESDRAPAQPARYLHRVDGAHEHAQ